MNRRVLIVGSGGQLGIELFREFGARGYEVTGLKRAELDIADPVKVDHCIAGLDPAFVINAAAYNMVDVAEKEPAAAFQVNALAVRNLAVACRQADATLVHFSTDYVFDGEKGTPYVEEDETHPLGAYAVSKLAGELYARAYLEKALVIRTSGVFGPQGLNTARGNFIELMLRLAKSHQPIKVVEDHVASPTYSPVLAARTADLVERRAHGIYHAGGGTPISWFEYARLIFRLAGLEPELRPTNEREYRTAARRPRYSALSNNKLEASGVEPFPSLETAVRSYLQLRERYATTS
ncbi:MAG: dTDP-4-dehydrorhamnose reductase [Acidobacteria bacterium]|nr:dTDP-4-dehydrorhamnose reductase [Acidobacteriota bacterium]